MPYRTNLQIIEESGKIATQVEKLSQRIKNLHGDVTSRNRTDRNPVDRLGFVLNRLDAAHSLSRLLLSELEEVQLDTPQTTL